MNKEKMIRLVGRVALLALLSVGFVSAQTATNAGTGAPPVDTRVSSTATAAGLPAATPASTPKPVEGAPRYGGTLTVSAASDPTTLDMHQDASFLTSAVLQCAYNGITQFDPQNPDQVIGDLVSRWETSKDGLLYTFHLNDGVKFHDGSPLTAGDVQFSFQRMITPPTGGLSPRRVNLAAVDKIEAVDKNTVNFTLKYSSGAFLNVISSGWMVIYSRALVEKKGNMKNDVMGTGPYRLKGYLMGTSLEYVRNADYFIKGRPYLDGITFYIVKDPGTRLAASRTGQVRLTSPGGSGLSAADAETIKKSMPQAVVTVFPSYSRTDILMNTQRKPWNDVRVRKAVSLALDRQAGISVLEQGYGDVGSNFPGPLGIPKEELMTMPGWRQPKDQDIAEAKRLLAEASFPDGFSAKCLVRADKQFEELSVYVASQMAKIGIKLDLDVKDQVVRLQMMERGDFEFHPRVASLSFPDPDDVARYWAAPLGQAWGMNYQRTDDKVIWDLFDKQSRAVDPAERKKVVRELDLRLIDTANVPLIYWRNAMIGMWPEVRDRGKVAGFFSFQKYQDIWLAK